MVLEGSLLVNFGRSSLNYRDKRCAVDYVVKPKRIMSNKSFWVLSGSSIKRERRTSISVLAEEDFNHCT
jgi:hypothetical protein